MTDLMMHPSTELHACTNRQVTVDPSWIFETASIEFLVDMLGQRRVFQKTWDIVRVVMVLGD
jgi:hypothetical protein